MKNKILVLTLLYSFSTLADSCRLEVIERKSCSEYSDYSTRITTTVITSEPGRVVVTEESGHPSYPYCNTSRSLGLKANGYIEYESIDLVALFTEAGLMMENGSCESFIPQKCEAIRTSDNQIYVMIDNRVAVPVSKGSPAESLLEARKLVSLLSIRNLCK